VKKFSVLVGIMSLTMGALVLAAPGPQTAPTTQPVLVSLADKQALAASMGKDVVVEGTVSDAQWSTSGKVFLVKFKEGEATRFQGAVFSKFREAMEKSFHGDLSNAFEGARIRISGKLQTYREHPEILIDDPKQITVLAKGPGNSPHASPTTRPSTQRSA